jgi:CRP-like cAMP-binding protein
MSVEPRELKDKAAQLFAKGRFAKAAEAYDVFCKADPKDLQARLRLGDAWAKAGQKDKAVSAYQWAAQGFAKDGFLPRAIAASKLVLELDPGHSSVQKMLADLYARKAGSARASGAARALGAAPPQPPAPPPAAAAVVVAVPHANAAATPVEVEIPIEVDAPVGAQIEVEVEVALPEPVTPLDTISPELAPVPAPTVSVAPRTALEDWSQKRIAGPVLADSETDLERSLRDSIEQKPVPQRATSFTELELEPESLLEAIEAVAAPFSSPSGLLQLEEPSEPSALPKIPLFSDLPEAAFIALFEKCPLRRFSPGEVVFAEGSRGESFFVICAGRVRVVRGQAAEQRLLATLEEGAFFGELALLSDATRTASVVAAEEDTQLLEIHGEVLKRLSAAHPQVAVALKKFSRQRLLANLINAAPLFRPFSSSERRQLVERFKAREVVSGEVLLKEGQPSDGLYVVLVGEVAVQRGGLSVASLREGDLFGEMSLLTRGPAAATVVAVRRTSVLRLPRDDFEQLMMSHPQILELVAELNDTRGRANATDGLL